MLHICLLDKADLVSRNIYFVHADILVYANKPLKSTS